MKGVDKEFALIGYSTLQFLYITSAEGWLFVFKSCLLSGMRNTTKHMCLATY